MSDGGRRWLLRIADAARTIIRLSRKQPFVPSPKVGSARHVNRGETKAPGGEVCPTGRRPPNPTLTGGCEVRVTPGGDTRKCRSQRRWAVCATVFRGRIETWEAGIRRSS